MIEASVKFFLQRLDDLLLRDPETFLGLQDQILKLKSLLCDKIWYFEEINIRIEKDDVVSLQWIQELKITIHNIEDCLDEFFFLVKNQNGSHQTAVIVQFGSKLEKFAGQLAEIMSRVPGNSTQLIAVKEERNEGEASSSVSSQSNSKILPYYLHSCLMYCCIFPEDYQIPKGRLVRLLVAEGLVQEKPGETMEDIATENIENLINFGFLHVVDGITDHGTKFKVHGQYRVLLRQKMEGEGFVASCISSETDIRPSVRRVSIHDDLKNIPTNLNNSFPLRALFMFGIDRRLSEAELDSLRSVFLGVKFLRVLDLEDIQMKSLPDEVGNLMHLKYLGLKKSDIEDLPESLCNLQNLQTLDIRWNGKLERIPSGILNLTNLRHLKMFKNMGVCGVQVPVGIEKLKNLLTVTGLYAGEGIANELGCLNQLRRLGVMDLTEDIASDLWVSIVKLDQLVALSLEAKHNYNGSRRLPCLDPLTSPPPLLQKLRLEGQLEKVPNWFGLMGNLTKLRLGFTHLSEDPASVLQLLPNLKHLSLWQAYDSKRIEKEFCRVGGFPKLEVLIIASSILEEWTELEEGAFPSLKRLHMHNCLNLKMLPEGLQHVTTLQQLNLLPLLDEHEERLRPDGGEENYKIKHIPRITFITTSMVNRLAQEQFI